jgi:membrane carboxypeptidase/penicillin-binding protein
MNPVRRKRRRWKRVLAYLALVLLCLMLGGMTFVGVLYYQVAQMMPSVNVLEGYKPREASEIYSADGRAAGTDSGRVSGASAAKPDTATPD